ncbi:uncharacterized protein LOC112588860 [Harpegnathos saltator]|uniref:uncharacterized protein LOC112588860 n=1 Tax=Harpegnathos saltator TaxID=610380 RepID=UPI000DBEE14B|nr:uncharacterized protein LOC112588860 [Harpegnathos saltator]
MACAPYLALRVIQQLADDDGYHFPLAAPILRENIYVDDVLFGNDSIPTLKQTRKELVQLLLRGGFELRKWAGNSPSLLTNIESENCAPACSKSLSSDETLKILGVTWNPVQDVFQLAVTLDDVIPKSKRSVLAAIARLYDPLGWVTPVTITAKIFMQRLWKEGLDWDSLLPPSLLPQWRRFYTKLSSLRELRIPRWTGFGSDVRRAELHGFSDASNVAYSAAVYLKVVTTTGHVTVSLLIGKSKVASLTPTSVPRLELQGAVLLAQAMEFVRATLSLAHIPCFCWTDSMVVLAWLRQHPSRWKTFVANRVADIQSRLKNVEWRHIATSDNPADCASRGLLGDELIAHSLWWRGPIWLSQPSEEWPSRLFTTPVNASLEEKVVSIQCSRSSTTSDLVARFSSWSKLLRVTAYVLRFISRCRRLANHNDTPPSYRLALSPVECHAARVFWIKTIQNDVFPAEVKALLKGLPVATTSSSYSLCPFLDSDGVVRVRGRLRNAPIPISRRHPILLARHPLVDLIIDQAHQRTLHAGLQLTLGTLRHDFWILRARSLIQAVIYRCIVCTRERAATPSQLIGDLPAVRVSAPERVFLHCGLDYAGPLLVRTSSGRGIKAHKAYIALFVCLATRAIHLELVSDYSTASFLNAFSRFCARRGLPRSIYSDNGTTFVGADRELRNAYRAALRDPNLLNKTAGDNVSWHFVPPSAPYFGGIWEAGVRSVKHHLRRVLKSYTLTFEELTILLCRVEACLNSRPIAPLSDECDNFDFLTPGHFLIGSALTTNPEPSTLELNENRLSRWQLVRHITEVFWKRWYNEYINTLQQRCKWRAKQPNIQVGRMVLLRNPNLPPCKWELDRITQCHPGSDSLARVVTVRTATSEYRRPLIKLCLLPIECANDTAI